MEPEKVRIEPVSDANDIEEWVRAWDRAIRTDPIHTFFEQYGPKTVIEETMEKVRESLEDPKYYIFKAVSSEKDAKSGVTKDVIVGGSHWYVGYLQVPKYDPFAEPRPEADNGDEVAVPPPVVAAGEKATGQIDASEVKTEVVVSMKTESNVHQDVVRRLRNDQITAIRGKKHVYLRRVFVAPEYQRRGIGNRLLQWGVDRADEEKLVGWLFARPAGSRMYEKAGWKAVKATEVNVPNLDVPPIISMLREPKAQ